jgi:tyrosine-protein phosphatase SIW14
MSTRSRSVLVVLAVAASVGGGVTCHKLLRWKRFDVVEPGVLYRSGTLTSWQLRRAVESYGIRTVFSFTHTDHSNETAVCARLGVRRYFCYLPGDGVGPDDPYLRFLQIVEDPDNHPILVHCSAGVQRTGGAVALFRSIIQGWPFDSAIDEMLAKGNRKKPAQIDQLRGIYQTFSDRADLVRR